MNAFKHFGIVLVITVYQFFLVIVAAILIYPIFQIIGKLFDGSSINIGQIIFDVIVNIYSKVYSTTFLKIFFLAFFIRLIGGYWLSKIKRKS